MAQNGEMIHHGLTVRDLVCPEEFCSVLLSDLMVPICHPTPIT
ncbi:hypothetical protein TPY_2349 [Sulfobacillus acidophilus TPY]|nr:hypothetical protein TPY_2349 [Sulfobacillus acidophilus TPY]